MDALGWEVLRNRPFLEDELPHRQAVRSVLGYSSACVPSILTGRQPRDHGHWSFFYCSPETSPFRALRPLRLLPRSLTGRARVRNLLSKAVAKQMDSLATSSCISSRSSIRRTSSTTANGTTCSAKGASPARRRYDKLRAAGTPFHLSDWRASEETNLASMHAALAEGAARFAFLYLADLDGALHMVGKDDASITARVASYESRLREVLREARKHYGEVRLSVISDHGMAHVTRTFDLQAVIAQLPLQFGRDYVAALDSTMARFWVRSEAAARLLPEVLAAARGGHLLSEEELVALGCDFPGQRYGQLIFLMDPGHLIVPSHMGLKPIRGMHGYITRIYRLGRRFALDACAGADDPDAAAISTN